MDRWVEIQFDCIPLRSIDRLDIPMDASPKFQEHCLRVKAAMEKHGSHNTYYLHNAKCTYHLLNHPVDGMIQFKFHGTVMTAEDDMTTKGLDLQVELLKETCTWLSEPIVNWFQETVQRSVAVEFDHYIQAGDLKKTEERIAKIKEESESDEGFLGMYL
ncbi:hypothetical protein [Bremerella alba]|uniref:Uncharacterized protein n=1 Tax=Bremerella alba TaxID=980252 RepID=A0A7V9A9P0_9BACT|nr:hypothetical protein [Bremerella alba]MBA2117548.1 hypothetical protein [Bremerella alba]